MNLKRGFQRLGLILTVCYALAAVGLAGWVFNELRVETVAYRYEFARMGKCYSVQASNTATAWQIAKTEVGGDVAEMPFTLSDRACTPVNYAPSDPTERATLGRAVGFTAATLVAAFFAYLATCLAGFALFRVSRWVIQGFREES